MSNYHLKLNEKCATVLLEPVADSLTKEILDNINKLSVQLLFIKGVFW